MKYIRSNNWRPIQSHEEENVLITIKKEVRGNVIIPAFVLALMSCCFIGILVAVVITGMEHIVTTVITLVGGLFIMLLISAKVLFEKSKIKAIKQGKAYAAEMKVSSKGLERWGRLGSYYAVRIDGLYDDNNPVERSIFVSRVIYKSTAPGDVGLVIRYDGKTDGRLPNSISYVPKL